MGFLNGKKSGGWSDQHRYRIDGKVTETWRSVGFRVSAIINETDAKEMLEEARRLAYYLLIDEPCHAEFSDQPIEVVCGLSRGRKL